MNAHADTIPNNEADSVLFKRYNGNAKRNILTEFNSNNTDLLDVEQVKQKLLSLEYIQNELYLWKETK